MTIQKTCLSISCPERKSLCCGAVCTNGAKGEPQFVCSNCRKEYQGGECTADMTTIKQKAREEWEADIRFILSGLPTNADHVIDRTKKYFDTLISSVQQSTLEEMKKIIKNDDKLMTLRNVNNAYFYQTDLLSALEALKNKV